MAIGSLLRFRQRVSVLSELVDQEAKPLLLIWQEILVIRLWKCAADAIHLEILLMVMILEVIILVVKNIS